MAPEDKAAALATDLSTAPSTQPRIGFFDLSPELRNEIYHLALVKRRDLHIRRTGNPQRKWAGYISNSYDGISINGSRILFSRKPLDINAELLRVSRQVHSEAKPILYGSNTFAMDWADVFVCLAHSTRPMLRQLKITGAWPHPFAQIMTRLRAFTPVLKLSKLEFAVESFAGENHAAQEIAKLMPALLPVLKAWKEQRSLDADTTVSLVGIAVGDDCPWFTRGPRTIETICVWNAEIQKQARELLA